MTIIELGKGQSAEPNKCGSCEFFRHRQSEYDTCGICSFRLPPWVRKRGDGPDESHEVDPRTVQDINSCDLYRPRSVDGKPVEFAQRRTWVAGSQSR